ncbi:hypothetical protein Pla52o_57140 [Novipirellula galeiformis]|uniref:Uncharacterized protein n=1 Tax=Novipirellula galeiformis TaxID=2528004 RepID=A0A5C6BEK2_9BACT|nr:hypothetical protein [Novipirellula galeiformis]TWU10340.1 hypothetical protein Pla52o_57140 [Novipirellula galeiformis]
MRYMKLIFAVTLTIVCAIAIVNRSPTKAIADEIADVDKVFPVSHRLNDLPVWNQDGKTFNPMILMAYLKASADTAGWGKTSTMAPYPPEKPSVLVISTTSADHDLIADALKRLRDSMVQTDVE